jgi:Raf kinase inhibitor-like YbhB/YbcL family protein
VWRAHWSISIAILCVGALFLELHPQAKEQDAMTMILSSESFHNNGMIPSRHTCDGSNSSPELSWTGVPGDARSLVLLIDDPDAPDPQAPQVTWVHWLLYNIPPSAHGLPEGVASKSIPAGTLHGVNDWHRTGYGGPCPPVGRHRYFHKLFVLDARLPDLKNPDKAALEHAMQGHVLARTELVGLYERGLTDELKKRIEAALRESKSAIVSKDVALATERAETLKKVLKEAGAVLYTQSGQAKKGGPYAEARWEGPTPQPTVGAATSEARPSGAGPRGKVVDAQYRESK